MTSVWRVLSCLTSSRIMDSSKVLIWRRVSRTLALAT